MKFPAAETKRYSENYYISAGLKWRGLWNIEAPGSKVRGASNPNFDLIAFEVYF
jgi:hypothetical protein